MNAKLTLEQLPDDILYDIVLSADELDWRAAESYATRVDPFKHWVPPVQHRKMKATAKVISQLSQHWRNLINGWPRCWILQFYVRLEGPDVELAQFSTALESSQLCDIDLWIHITPRVVEEVFDLFIPRVTQLRAVYQYLSPDVRQDPRALRLLSSMTSCPRLSHMLLRPSKEQVWHTDFHNPRKLSNLKATHVPLRELCRLGLTQAKHLEIQGPRSSTTEIVELLRSLDFTEKLSIDGIVLEPAEYPDPNGIEKNLERSLTALRLRDDLVDILWLLAMVDMVNGRAIERLNLFVTSVRRTVPLRQVDFIHLTDVTMFARDIGPFYELLRTLPISRIQKLTMYAAERSQPLRDWERLTASSLTTVAFKGPYIEDALTILQTLNMPSLEDLKLQPRMHEYSSQTIAYTIPPCPKLLRASLPYGYPSNIKLLKSISAPNLRVLDFHKVKSGYGNDHRIWMEILSMAQDILERLEALSFQVMGPASTSLWECLSHFPGVRTLKLTFTDSSLSVEVLRLLSTSDRHLPNLQVLQVTFGGISGGTQPRDVAAQLQELVSYRKIIDCPIKQLGVLFHQLMETPDDSFSWFYDNVEGFELGDVCQDVFLDASDISPIEEWDAW